MSESYDPQHYWEDRLQSRFNLQGVGNIGFTEHYNAWLYRRKRRCLETCFRRIPLQGKTVLDVGCGTGFFVNWYLKKGASVYGIDITQMSIQRLKAKFSGEFYTQDITDRHYRPLRRFDIVNMWDVIYHVITPEQCAQAFTNISKSITDDGLLLFTDSFGLQTDRRIANHVQARCLKTYRELLPKSGFQLLGLYPLYSKLNSAHLGRFDNYLGSLYFFLDTVQSKIAEDNISLSLWRRIAD